MAPSVEFVKKIETDYLKMVADCLRKGKIDFKTAKESAKELLTLFPFTSYEDMQTKIQQFTQKYTQFDKLYVNFLSYEEEAKTQELIEKMRVLMKSNKIDEALHIAK